MTLTRDVRLATRFLRRHRAFTLTSAAILALGIGMSTILFAIVVGTLLTPWPYRGASRIVTTRGNYPAQGRSGFALWSSAEVRDLRQSGIFESVIAGDARDVNLMFQGRPERVRAAVITPNAFAMLGVRARLGRTLDADDVNGRAADVVVVSNAFWRRQLGADPNVVGRRIDIESVPFTIVGVMPPSFVFWDRDLWMPLRLDFSAARTERRYYLEGLLPEGMSLSQAEERLAVLGREWAQDHPEVPEYRGLTIALRPLVEDVLRELRPTLYVLLAAVAMLLVVTAANLANAILAKGMEREREVAVRRALGASALQIAAQLIVEIAFIGSAAVAAGVAAAYVLLPYVVALVPSDLIPAEATIAIDWRVVAGAIVVAAMTAATAALIPALRAVAVDPARLLNQGSTRSASRRTNWYREAISIAQLTLAVVVLASGLNLARSMRDTLTRDEGFTADDVWTVRTALPTTTPERAAAAYETIQRQLLATPGIRDAAIGSALPTDSLPTVLVSSQGSPASRGGVVESAVTSASPGFLRVLSVRLKAGRAIEQSDVLSGRRVALVSESLASHLWPGAPAVGSQLTIQSPTATAVATVIGVTYDVATIGDSRRLPVVFVPVAQAPPESAVLAIEGRPGDPFTAVRAALHRVDATLPLFQPETLARARLEALGPQWLALVLMCAFTLAVLALSALGIHAVFSQSLQERRREIWIRLALGAGYGDVVPAELLRAGRLAAVAGVAGAALAFAAERVTAASLPGIHGASLTTIAIAIAIVVVLLFVSTAPVAHRAAAVELAGSSPP